MVSNDSNERLLTNMGSNLSLVDGKINGNQCDLRMWDFEKYKKYKKCVGRLFLRLSQFEFEINKGRGWLTTHSPPKCRNNY